MNILPKIAPQPEWPIFIYSFLRVLSLTGTLYQRWFMIVSQGFSRPPPFQYHLSVTPINRYAVWAMSCFTQSIDALASVFVMKRNIMCTSHALISIKCNLLNYQNGLFICALSATAFAYTWCECVCGGVLYNNNKGLLFYIPVSCLLMV